MSRSKITSFFSSLSDKNGPRKVRTKTVDEAVEQPQDKPIPSPKKETELRLNEPVKQPVNTPINFLLNFYEDGVKDVQEREKLLAPGSEYSYYGEVEENKANIDQADAERSLVLQADNFVKYLYEDNALLIACLEFSENVFKGIPTFEQYKNICKLTSDKVEAIEQEDYQRWYEDFKNDGKKDIRRGEYARSKLSGYQYGCKGYIGGFHFSRQIVDLKHLELIERSNLGTDLDSYKRLVSFIIESLNDLSPSDQGNDQKQTRAAYVNNRIFRSIVPYETPVSYQFPDKYHQIRAEYLYEKDKIYQGEALTWGESGSSYWFAYQGKFDRSERSEAPRPTQSMPPYIYWEYLKQQKLFSRCSSDPRIDYLLTDREVKLRFDIFGKAKIRYGALVPRRDQEKHSYIVGGTGSGKSELLKYIEVQEILKNDRNSILLDPHGDVAAEIINIKMLYPKAAKNIIYVDTSIQDELGQKAQNLPCINPLEVNRKYINTREKLESVAYWLSLAFEEITGTDNTVNMRAMLIPCLCVLLERDGSTLYDLDRFMDDDLNDDLVAIGRKSPNQAHARYFESKFLTKKTKVTKEALSIRLQVMLNSTVFSKMTCGKTTIDFNEIVRGRGTHVIFRLNKENSSSIQRELGILIITAVLNASFTVPKSQRIGTHLLIDEFQNFVFSDMGTILEQCRKYKLHLTLAHQFIDQITDTAIKKSILTNANIKIIGAGGGTIVKVLKGNGEANIEQEFVDTLRPGRFLIRINSKGAFYDYLNVPATVVNRFVKWVDLKTKKAFLKQQYQDYYHVEKTSSKKPKSPGKKSEPKLDFKDF